MWDVNLMLLHKIECRSGRVGSGQVSRSCRVVSRVGSGSGRVGSGQGRSGRLRVQFFFVGSGLCRSGRYWVGSGWVGSSPCRVVVGLGRAFVGSGCGQ